MPVRKVLVVDDSPTDLSNIRNILSDAGVTVVSAGSGKEGVAKANTENPDLIFMDIVMSDMDGYEACRELNMNDTTKSIPVVFVSSKTQKADKLWAQMQGGKAYVTKPYTADQIIDQLKAFA